MLPDGTLNTAVLFDGTKRRPGATTARQGLTMANFYGATFGDGTSKNFGQHLPNDTARLAQQSACLPHQLVSICRADTGHGQQFFLRFRDLAAWVQWTVFQVTPAGVLQHLVYLT